MRQYQSPKPVPRPNDLTERFALRLSKSDRRKLMRKGGAQWLRQLIRQA